MWRSICPPLCPPVCPHVCHVFCHPVCPTHSSSDSARKTASVPGKKTLTHQMFVSYHYCVIVVTVLKIHSDGQPSQPRLQ